MTAAILHDPARVQRTWRLRTVAEYTSAARTAELLHWLLAVGASPDTLGVCHRIVGDEMAHAEFSRAVYLEAGGDPAAVPVVRESLHLPHEAGQPLELRALAVLADVFCCGETVAVPLFAAIRAPVTVPVAKQALDRILADEGVHRAFGWDTLDELLERLGPEARTWLRRKVPGYVQRVRVAYAAPGKADLAPLPDSAWGVMPAGSYGELCERCVVEVIRPRFVERLGAIDWG